MPGTALAGLRPPLQHTELAPGVSAKELHSRPSGQAIRAACVPYRRCAKAASTESAVTPLDLFGARAPGELVVGADRHAVVIYFAAASFVGCDPGELFEFIQVRAEMRKAALPRRARRRWWTCLGMLRLPLIARSTIGSRRERQTIRSARRLTVSAHHLSARAAGVFAKIRADQLAGRSPSPAPMPGSRRRRGPTPRSCDLDFARRKRGSSAVASVPAPIRSRSM